MIVKDAFVFLIPLLILALGAIALGMPLAGIFLLLLSAFVAFFFRNPRRKIPEDPKVIVSPADGRVVKVERVGNVTKLSIFLSIFNVHVNRSPIAWTDRGDGLQARTNSRRLSIRPRALKTSGTSSCCPRAT